MTRTPALDQFTRAYLHAAAWTEDPDPGQGEYPEPVIGDLDPAFVERAIEDCQSFQAACGEYFQGEDDRAGHDFWLTRNGHGAGFWDEDWPVDRGQLLSLAAECYGAVDDWPFAGERPTDGEGE